MLDEVTIRFDPNAQLVLNIMLALMMFGVALTLQVRDFTRVVRKPAAPVIGLICQFVLLPALTCALTMALEVPASMALGMMLVAACPGGSFSNLITFIARGNVATSVTMTAVSSLAAVILTPLNFAFYAWLNPATRALLTDIALSPWQVLSLVFLVLGVPLLIGMWVGHKFPQFASRSETPMRRISLGLFALLVGLAFANNMSLFTQHWHHFVGYVIAQNAIALLLGYGAARLARLKQNDVRALTFEVGIQNSGLGLVLMFTFMPDLGGAMIITAFWGVWHLVSGGSLAWLWSRRPHPAGDSA
ncbi:bile acid:sodium symporter family protein [Aestuariibacter halophilus]|uniref:Bile acid:sodium symporter family protein n=1 Tax=Fluctibacter halophilus TaxID=226011 RepID=A0ABS8G8Z6_9ALTE|nr:bile acid:sodium symporter family protein [Aestuariibacter halophilus]MCC2616179.1 bile acid:sodium symporter family protein [Aestuariibacter halophilus]